jgi:uncharacterized protein
MQNSSLNLTLGSRQYLDWRKYLLALTVSITASGISVANAQPAVDQAAEAKPVCTVEMVPMRDRVRMATEIYRPQRPGKYPIILQRGPYNGHSGIFPVSNCDNPQLMKFAAAGYVVLLQDVRGTYRSAGTFQPILQEGDDGYDTVEWAARQRWSTGKVGMIGGSYQGVSQWQAAFKTPPHLVTIVPQIAPTRLDNGWPYQTGVFGQLAVQSWTAILGKDQLWRRLTASDTPPEKITAELAAYDAKMKRSLFRPLQAGVPLSTDPLYNNDLTPWYANWLGHSAQDAYWTQLNADTKYASLNIPVLSVGSFYDLFSGGTVDGFVGMQQRAGNRGRTGARLVMAGGGHAQGPNNFIGNVSFGPENKVPDDLYLRWFDHWLKGVPNGIMDEPAVKLYVMLPPNQGSSGSGFWVSGPSFPLPGTEVTPYYLGGGEANSAAGAGTLAPVSPAEAGADMFPFDPAHPVRTIGGNLCCSAMLMPGGAFDQRPVENRADVLIYTGTAMTEPVAVIGSPSVTLHAKTSAPRTTFTAKLVDVYPDGYAQLITDGIISVVSKPDQGTTAYTIKLSPTATVFKPGHRIRLEVSSSNYPRFAVSPSTPSDPKPLVTQQTVYWGPNALSRLNLPIAPVKIPTALSK